MRFRRILSAVMAGVVAISGLAVSASAELEDYDYNSKTQTGKFVWSSELPKYENGTTKEISLSKSPEDNYEWAEQQDNVNGFYVLPVSKSGTIQIDLKSYCNSVRIAVVSEEFINHTYRFSQYYNSATDTGVEFNSTIGKFYREYTLKVPQKQEYDDIDDIDDSMLKIAGYEASLWWDSESEYAGGSVEIDVSEGNYLFGIWWEGDVPKSGTGKVVYDGTGTCKVTITYPGSSDSKTSVSAPTTLKSAAKSTTSTKITWNDIGADSYNIYRSTSKNGTYKKISSATGTSYIDKNLTKGKTYYYKVTSVSGGSESDFSKIVSAKACAPTPSGVTAAKAKSGAAKLSWKKSSGAEGYVIYMSDSSDGKYTKAKTVTSGSTLSFTKTGLTSGKTYYFKVRSYITVNGKKVYSGYSKVVKAKV